MIPPEELRKRLCYAFADINAAIGRIMTLCEETDEPEIIELSGKISLALASVRKIRLKLDIPYDWPKEDNESSGN